MFPVQAIRFNGFAIPGESVFADCAVAGMFPVQVIRFNGFAIPGESVFADCAVAGMFPVQAIRFNGFAIPGESVFADCAEAGTFRYRQFGLLIRHPGRTFFPTVLLDPVTSLPYNLTMTTGEQLYMLQMAAKNGDILPQQETTYVLNEKGERRPVYFNDKSGVFASIRIGTDDPVFHLDIRRPLVVDCTGLEDVGIPDMPEESDGIIFLHCGNTEGAAYVVRSEEQVIDI